MAVKAQFFSKLQRIIKKAVPLHHQTKTTSITFKFLGIWKM